MTDLFVIGGGPAGLALAMAAGRRGMRVTVADRSRPPVDKACGEGLMPDGLAALRSLGVEVDPAECFPFRGIRFLDNGRAVDASFPVGHGLGIRRTVLHRAMVGQAEAAGIRLMWGAQVERIGPEGVRVAGTTVPCAWIAGADGGNSAVRRWAALDRYAREDRRFGFRRHYRIEPWTDCMELYWGEGFQIYVTPVAPRELCLVAISDSPRLRLECALAGFPELAARLAGAPAADYEKGAITATRTLRRVYRGSTVLLGDASGSVDAVTGEGICLAFRQAMLLAACLESGDLARYQAEHRRLLRRPRFMSDLMLSIGSRPGLRRRAGDALLQQPGIFRSMLAAHVGALPLTSFAPCALSLGWRILTA